MSLATREQKAVVTDFCACRALWFFHAMKERIRFKIDTKNARQLTLRIIEQTYRKLYIQPSVNIATNSKPIFPFSKKRTPYFANENFILKPKSVVVVGYELAEMSGMVFCLSK